MGFDLNDEKSFVWMNGEFVPIKDAKISILSHVVHYGSGVFEGVRCYKGANGPVIFRMKEHTKRLFNSAKIYRMFLNYTEEQINQAQIDTIKKNNMEECYIRPLVYRGCAELGVNPFKCPVEVAIAVWKWGKYLGPEALEKGIDVMVSSWTRLAPNTMPALAKACSNYMNSQLIKMEALTYGFAEGIALDASGYVSEGSGENLFIVKDDIIITPPLGASVLCGITRDSVITIAKDMGYKVIEQLVPREMLYIADEVFLTGTAAEISPIASIDKIKIGAGKRGPVTAKFQDMFFGIIEGKYPDKYSWLTSVK